jgi:hypothetical protein
MDAVFPVAIMGERTQLSTIYEHVFAKCATNTLSSSQHGTLRNL